MNTGALNSFAIGAGGGVQMAYAESSTSLADSPVGLATLLSDAATDALLTAAVFRALNAETLDSTTFATEADAEKFRGVFTFLTTTLVLEDQTEIQGTVGRIVDIMSFTTVPVAQPVYTILDSVLLTSVARGLSDFIIRAAAQLTLEDTAILVQVGQALSSLEASTSAEATRAQLAEALALLQVLDSATPRHELVARAAAVVMMLEGPYSVATGTVQALLTATDEAAARFVFLASLAETLLVLADAEAGKTALLRAVDLTSFQLSALGQIRTTGLAATQLGVTFELLILGQTYDAWAVNTETGAASQYTNYSYDTLFAVQGKAFGTSPDGLFRLDGNTDNGEPIFARVVTGELDFGTTSLKRVEQAWIAYASDGDMVLKVIVRQKGNREEHWYRSRASGEGRTEAKLEVGRGLESHYWQFELVNAEGVDFELDGLQFRALALSRRV